MTEATLCAPTHHQPAPSDPCPAPITILFLDHTAQLGGGELALLRLVTNLDPANYRPVVLLFSDGPLVDRFRDSNVEIHVLPLHPAIVDARKDLLGAGTLFRIADVCRLLLYVFKLARLIRKTDARLVHTNSLKSDIIGALAARLAGRRVIWHVRDRIADDYLPSKVVRVFRMACRILPHYVIANSAATLETLGEPLQASAIPSGVELRRRTQIVHDGLIATAGDSRNHSKPGAGPKVGLIGRIAPWKGQHIFIESAALVMRQFPKARFVIVGSAMFGETSYEADLRTRVLELGLDTAVEFLGYCDAVEDVMPGLDIVVHASTIPEPFGQVVIEAMAAGKPVIATRGGGITEIVTDKINGKLVPMGSIKEMAEAICELLADPQLASELACRARAHAATHFSIEATVQQVQGVYDHLLQSQKSDK